MDFISSNPTLVKLSVKGQDIFLTQNSVETLLETKRNLLAEMYKKTVVATSLPNSHYKEHLVIGPSNIEVVIYEPTLADICLAKDIATDDMLNALYAIDITY